MNKLIYFILIVLVVVISCDDFFEEDLKDKSVSLIAPTDNLQTSSSSFTFWWEEVEGATKYNLQIVNPNFDAIEKLVLDTNVTSNQYEAQLYPGNFQWRVKAYNSASETAYTTYSLIVDSTLDLSTSEVILISPSNLSVTNENVIDFSWNQVYNATDYTIKIRKGTWDGQAEHLDETNNLTSYTHEFSSDGTYIWGIMATNSTSSSQYSIREITIDRVNPDKPNQTSPDNDAEITGTSVTFSWTKNTDNGSLVFESILIDTISTFTSSALEEIGGLDLTYKHDFNVSAGETKTYYWKIKSVDQAGNESEYTDFRRFKLKNEEK